MSDLTNQYQQIMKDLESNIKDERELQFIKTKFSELSMLFMDVIDRLSKLTELKVKNIEATQKDLDNKLSNLQSMVNGIESDIYEENDEDDSYEFEIVCPYCNHEFVTDIETNMKEEVECPECHNMIELDWNLEEECGHECSHCGGSCVAEEEEDYEIEIEDNTKTKKNKKMKQENWEEEPEDEDEDM